MTNKEKVIEKLKQEGYGQTLSCYDKDIENISAEEMEKVLEMVGEEFTDVEVQIKGDPYIVEIETVGNEKDLHLIHKEEYNQKYGANK